MKRPKDIKCPYCGHEQDIDHSDGYGHEPDKLHEQECNRCEQTFGFETSISFSYEVQNVPCFNGKECEWYKSSRSTIEGAYDVQHFLCRHCDSSKMEHLEVPTRLKECIAAEMPVACDTCSNNESCGGLRASTSEEECIKADYSHWAPPTKAKQDKRTIIFNPEGKL